MLGLFPPPSSYQTVCGNLCPFLTPIPLPFSPFLPSTYSFSPPLPILHTLRFTSSTPLSSSPATSRLLCPFPTPYPLPHLFLFPLSVPPPLPLFLRTCPTLLSSSTFTILPYFFSSVLPLFLLCPFTPNLPPSPLHNSFRYQLLLLPPPFSFSPTLSFLPALPSPLLPASLAQWRKEGVGEGREMGVDKGIGGKTVQ